MVAYASKRDETSIVIYFYIVNPRSALKQHLPIGLFSNLSPVSPAMRFFVIQKTCTSFILYKKSVDNEIVDYSWLYRKWRRECRQHSFFSISCFFLLYYNNYYTTVLRTLNNFFSTSFYFFFLKKITFFFSTHIPLLPLSAQLNFCKSNMFFILKRIIDILFFFSNGMFLFFFPTPVKRSFRKSPAAQKIFIQYCFHLLTHISTFVALLIIRHLLANSFFLLSSLWQAFQLSYLKTRPTCRFPLPPSFIFFQHVRPFNKLKQGARGRIKRKITRRLYTQITI